MPCSVCLQANTKWAACGSGAANPFDYFASDKRADSDTVTASDKEPSLQAFLEPLKKKARRQFQRSWLNRWSWVVTMRRRKLCIVPVVER